MFKKIILISIVLLLGFLFSTYHEKKYLTEDLILKNWIQTEGLVTQNDVLLLEHIDASLISGNLYSWWLVLSSNSSAWLEDGIWWYSFVDSENLSTMIFIRASVSHTWRIENPFTMICEWAWCASPWWMNLANQIVHEVKPKKITDIVIEQSGQQTVLQWTWWSWIDKLKE